MRFAKVWQRLLGVERTVVDQVVLDEDEGAIVASVRPRKGASRRCGVCQRRCAWYDRGEGRRRWRTLDLGSVPAYLEADAPRVSCPTHGVVVVAFPWARHRARHTINFEDQVAWRAYLLKEELRLAIVTKGEEGVDLLAHWLTWASHCKIPAFVELGQKIRRHRVPIEQALRPKTSNALVESTNTKIRVLARVAFGFRPPEALIAMAVLAVGGVCPDLPGRATAVASDLAPA